MALFTLAYTTCIETLDYPVGVSTFEQLTEQRLLLSDKQLIGFKFTRDVATLAEMQAYRAELTAYKGAKTGFTFTSPFDAVTHTVRFNGPMKTSYKGGVFSVAWEFKVINADEA